MTENEINIINNNEENNKVIEPKIRALKILKSPKYKETKGETIVFNNIILI